MKKDLTQVDGTYSKLITDNIQAIYDAYNTKNANDFKAFVLAIIAPAKDTEAKRTFVLNMTRKYNKTDMLFYVNDAQLCGSGLGVNSTYKKY